MNSRERVAAVIRHEKPDRIPVYGWVSANLSEEITEAFGSVAAFEDAYEFDLAHLFGGPSPWTEETLQSLRDANDGTVTPEALLDAPRADPDASEAYDGLREQIRRHGEERERFTYVQTPGIFECLNGPFGIENHLMYMALHPDEIAEVYARQAEWNRAFAMNCLDLGVDMIHVSDDWGAQRGLMFAPDMWWERIHPAHKTTADAVKARGAFLSLHSDGHVMDVMDGILDLGYDVVHPWQESAGMSLEVFRDTYRDRLTVLGGLDVQTSIGFGRTDELVAAIERVMRMFADGGLLFCTTHFVQDHCSIEELTLAYDTAVRLAREVCA